MSLFCFLADIVWGIAFVAQSKGGDAVGAFSFNGIRFLIGALCLLPVIKILDKKELTVNRPESKKQKKELWIAGTCCGIALFFASNLQQLGISMGAESGKAGFLTATYILMVPIRWDIPTKEDGGDQNMDRCIYCTDRHVFFVHEWGIFT